MTELKLGCRYMGIHNTVLSLYKFQTSYNKEVKKHIPFGLVAPFPEELMKSPQLRPLGLIGLSLNFSSTT